MFVMVQVLVLFQEKNLFRFWEREKARVAVIPLGWIIGLTLFGGIVLNLFRHSVLRFIGLMLLGACLMACMIVWFSTFSRPLVG